MDLIMKRKIQKVMIVKDCHQYLVALATVLVCLNAFDAHAMKGKKEKLSPLSSAKADDRAFAFRYSPSYKFDMEEQQAIEIVRRYATHARVTGNRVLKSGYIHLRSVDGLPTPKDIDDLVRYASTHQVAVAITGSVVNPDGKKEEVVLASVNPHVMNKGDSAELRSFEVATYYPEQLSPKSKSFFKISQQYRIPENSEPVLGNLDIIDRSGKVTSYLHDENAGGLVRDNVVADKIATNDNHKREVDQLRSGNEFGALIGADFIAPVFKLANKDLVRAMLTPPQDPSEMRLHALWNGKTFLPEQGYLLHHLTRSSTITLEQQESLIQSVTETHLPAAVVGTALVNGEKEYVIIASAERIWDPETGTHALMVTKHHDNEDYKKDAGKYSHDIYRYKNDSREQPTKDASKTPSSVGQKLQRVTPIDADLPKPAAVDSEKLIQLVRRYSDTDPEKTTELFNLRTPWAVGNRLRDITPIDADLEKPVTTETLQLLMKGYDDSSKIGKQPYKSDSLIRQTYEIPHPYREGFSNQATNGQQPTMEKEVPGVRRYGNRHLQVVNERSLPTRTHPIIQRHMSK